MTGPERLEPRIVDGPALLIAGLSERYTAETNHAIPHLWQRFAPLIGRLPQQVGRIAYGVCTKTGEGQDFSYLAGVEVSSFIGLPDELDRMSLPARRYAVFDHAGNVATIRETVHAIWSRWAPAASHELVQAPDFERYTEAFDPSTGDGGVEIWIPIRS